MREANDRGFECLLIEDATESYFPEFKASAIEMITAQGGIVGWVAPAGEPGEGGGIRILPRSPGRISAPSPDGPGAS